MSDIGQSVAELTAELGDAHRLRQIAMEHEASALRAELIEAVQLLETIVLRCERSLPPELLSDAWKFLTRPEIKPWLIYARPETEEAAQTA